MATIEHQLTESYCFVDDYLKMHPELALWRRSNNREPAFTDAEVITIAVMQGCLGCDTLAKTYDLIAENYRSAFPLLPSYKRWIARLHALSEITGRLVFACCLMGQVRLYIMDSKPLPVCKPIRNGRVRLMREDGAYFGKSSIGWFFGFKLHAIIDMDGRILQALLLPANIQDRHAAEALAEMVDGGIGLGDHGYLGAAFKDELAEATDLLMVTPKDAGARRALISTIREKVETVFSQLWARFIDRIHSRSWHGLWNTVKLKLLHYNLVTAGLLTP
jgi:transposase